MRCARVPSAVVTATTLSSISWSIRTSARSAHVKGAMRPADVPKGHPKPTHPHAKPL